MLSMKGLTGGRRVLFALIASSTLSVFFFLIRVVHYGTFNYSFLNWNLFLAWLPLLFAWQLVQWLKKGRWLSWQGITLTLLLLGFLPNSFYLASDLIHLQSELATNGLYDVVMFLSFAWNGLILGFFSLYIVHLQLIKRLSTRNAHLIVAIVLLLCSFAIYLGRYLRWSTWDLLVNPAGVVFDVSDRVINPAAHIQTFTTTATFFLLLGTMYIVIWQFVQAIREQST